MSPVLGNLPYGILMMGHEGQKKSNLYRHTSHSLLSTGEPHTII